MTYYAPEIEANMVIIPDKLDAPGRPRDFYVVFDIGTDAETGEEVFMTALPPFGDAASAWVACHAHGVHGVRCVNHTSAWDVDSPPRTLAETYTDAGSF